MNPHQVAGNCEHLVQTMTQYTPAEIHAMALEKQADWTKELMDFSPANRYPIDHIIGTLLNLGLDQRDMAHLERLLNPAVL